MTATASVSLCVSMPATATCDLPSVPRAEWVSGDAHTCVGPLGSSSYQATSPHVLPEGPLKWKATPQTVGTSSLEAPPGSTTILNTHVVLLRQERPGQTD